MGGSGSEIVKLKGKWESTRGLAQVLRQCLFWDFAVDEGLCVKRREMAGRAIGRRAVLRC